MEDLVFQLLFGLIFGLINVYLAKRKGRNKRFALLLGFLFGIFAVIGYLVIRKVKKCPVCGQTIDFNAKTCPFCKTVLIKR